MNGRQANTMALELYREAPRELVVALQTSLYPGAREESIGMVLAYCSTRRLDPLKKPVHIVPMSVTVKGATPDEDSTEMRDVIMPGVGLYRIEADRSGRHCGTSEPEFGPDRVLEFTETIRENVLDSNGNIIWEKNDKGKSYPRKRNVTTKSSVTYPEWCRVKVFKMMPDGKTAEFVAIERWIENYATAGRDTEAPNTMWKKRPYGQLAKCAEAQALRKAFPDTLGDQATAEEMEGKVIDMRADGSGGWSHDSRETAAPTQSAGSAPKAGPTSRAKETFTSNASATAEESQPAEKDQATANGKPGKLTPEESIKALEAIAGPQDKETFQQLGAHLTAPSDPEQRKAYNALLKRAAELAFKKNGDGNGQQSLV